MLHVLRWKSVPLTLVMFLVCLYFIATHNEMYFIFSGLHVQCVDWMVITSDTVLSYL